MPEKEWLEGVVLGGLISMSVCVAMACMKIESIRLEAIETGHAEYDSKTGEWQWKAVPEKSDVE